MANDFMRNRLDFEQYLISEKLGLKEEWENDINTNLQLELLRDELAKNKRLVREMQDNKMRETFSTKEQVIGGRIGSSATATTTTAAPNAAAPVSDSFLSIFDDKRVLLFLVIVLFAICIMQYLHDRNRTNDFINMMCMLKKCSDMPGATPNAASSAAASIIPATNPVAV
jgi:hypothetical protein